MDDPGLHEDAVLPISSRYPGPAARIRFGGHRRHGETDWLPIVHQVVDIHFSVELQFPGGTSVESIGAFPVTLRGAEYSRG